MLTSLVTHAFVLIVGALLGGFIMRNNYAKSVKLLDELKAKAAEGNDIAKAYILTTLSNLKK